MNRSSGFDWCFASIGLILGCSWCTPKVAEAQSLPLIYDPALTSQEIQTIDNDIAQLSDARIQGDDVKWFNEIFGGPGGPNVFHWLSERVNVLVAPKTDVPNHLKPLGRTLNQEGGGEDPSQPQKIASNIGTAIFLAVVQSGEAGAELALGPDKIEVRSTRVGIVQLGDGYTSDLPSVFRLSALVHEARHSDCTGGLSEGDKALIRAGKDPVDKQCGHSHVDCPSGTYEGLPACDDHPWGAYSIQAVFSAAIATACNNCSDEAKSISEAIAVDAASRYPDFQKMVDGDFGPPNMQQTEVPLP